MLLLVYFSETRCRWKHALSDLWKDSPSTLTSVRKSESFQNLRRIICNTEDRNFWYIVERTQMEEQTKQGKSPTDRSVSLTLCGIALALIGGLTGSLISAVVKHLANIYTGQLAAYKFWCICSLALPQTIWKKEEILVPPGYRISMLIIALANTTAAILIYFTCRYLPLGEASVIYGSYPVFVPIVAKILLKETFGILHLIAVFVTITGLILTAGLKQAFSENTFTTENIYGIAAGLGAVVMATTYIVMCRKLNKVHHSVILFNGGMVGIIESILLTAFVGNFTFYHCGIERGFIIFLGFLSYISLLSTVASLRYLEAGPMTTVRSSSDVFFSFLSQVLIFGDVPQPASICGALLVCISITILGLGQKFRTLMPFRCFDLFSA